MFSSTQVFFSANLYTTLQIIVKMYHFQTNISKRLSGSGRMISHLPFWPSIGTKHKEAEAVRGEERRGQMLLKFSPYFKLSPQLCLQKLQILHWTIFHYTKRFLFDIHVGADSIRLVALCSFWIFCPSSRGQCTWVECPKLG